MSHILDALRRAEDERRLGRPPGRGVITSPLRASRRRTATAPRWVAIGIAVLGLAALLYAFLPERASDAPARSDSAGTPPVTRPASTPDPAPVAPASAEAEADAPIPRAQLADGARLRSLDALFPGVEGDQGPSAAARRSGAVALEPQDLFVAGGGTSARTGVDRDADAGSDRATSAASTPPPSSAETAPEPMLPAAQSDLPAFTIQVHVYDDDPERRFVRVGGRRYGIGERLPDGGMIADIVPDGLVVRWRDRLVKRALER
ncbi:general secretion pathway protein GspB [Algiphilus sp.]|uniref:general secretion pathway protein GspB n=1 Tax=Algiphilus sp. TaxID=1872431 RepID=UPI003C63E5B6